MTAFSEMPIGSRVDAQLLYIYLIVANISAFGTKRTSQITQPMSAFGGKADIRWKRFNVRK